MASVFLSYDHDDAKRARPIALQLEKAGHSVWWDLHVRGDAQFSKEIEEALDAAEVVVVLWSRDSVESAWVRDEAAAGRDTGRLVPGEDQRGAGTVTPAHNRGLLRPNRIHYGKDIGSREYLSALGKDLGLPAAEVDELFTTDKYSDEVRFDFQEARGLGISGVPFFVIDRKFGLSGAQPTETFTAALNQAWQEANPLVLVNSTDAEACGPDGCAI